MADSVADARFRDDLTTLDMLITGRCARAPVHDRDRLTTDLFERIDAIDAWSGQQPFRARQYVRHAALTVLRAVEDRSLDLQDYVWMFDSDPPGIPQATFVAEFQTRHAEGRVVKARGFPDQNEAFTLQTLSDAGFHGFPQLFWSDNRADSSLLVMERLRGLEESRKVLGLPWNSARLRFVTTELGALMGALHRVPVGRRSLEVTKDFPLMFAASSLAHGGYDQRAHSWAELSESLLSQGPLVPLHRDLKPAHVIKFVNSIRVVSPNAELGPPEMDAAQWIARFGWKHNLLSLTAAWLLGEPELDPSRLGVALCLAFFIEAGERAARDRATHRKSPNREVVKLLETSSALSAAVRDSRVNTHEQLFGVLRDVAPQRTLSRT